jgi:hypothetical protein
VDPSFKVVARAYPHVVRQLLSDRTLEMRAILASLIVDRLGRVRWARLQRFLAPVGSDPSPAAAASPHDPSSSSSSSSSEGVTSRLPSEDIAAALDEAITFLVSEKGGVVREGLLEDGADAADALAKELVEALSRPRNPSGHPLKDPLVDPTGARRRVVAAMDRAMPSVSAWAGLAMDAPNSWLKLAARTLVDPEVKMLLPFATP